jgi:hypothetical protein
MLKAAFLSVLEYGKHAFDRDGLHDPVAGGSVSDGSAVSRKLLAEFGVEAALVGMQGTLARSTPVNDVADLAFGCAVRLEGTSISPALH